MALSPPAMSPGSARQDNGRATHDRYPAEGEPSDSQRQEQSAFHFSRSKGKNQDMEHAHTCKGTRTSAGQWLTIRLLPDEKSHVVEMARLTGLSQSEYARRRFFGGRPVVAQTDITMIAELRRLGGLLKGHFNLLREQGVSPAILGEMETTLLHLRQAADRVGVR